MTTRFLTRAINETTRSPNGNHPSSSSDDGSGSTSTAKWNDYTGNRIFRIASKHSNDYYGNVTSQQRHSFFEYSSSSVSRFHQEDCNNNKVMILACSSSAIGQDDELDLFNSTSIITSTSDRVLCDDRKGWFDHLYPQVLAKNTIRITLTQTFQVLSHFFTEQLKLETELDAKVASGEMKRKQAALESDTWAEKEWKQRIEEIPNRILIALAKHHAITLVMRLYEYIVSKYVTLEKLDSLTLDAVECAKRTSLSRTYNSKSRSTEYVREMLPTIFNANIIMYLADYSVHQVILFYGYYLYVKQQRNKYRPSTTMGSDNNSQRAIEIGSMTLSYLKKSTLLLFQRGVWLVSASSFGAIGSAILPGWGTIAGLSVGDALGCNITDLLIHVDVPSTDSNIDDNDNLQKKTL